MKQIICDKCKKVLEKENFDKITSVKLPHVKIYHNDDEYYEYETYDLCDNCINKLNELINKLKCDFITSNIDEVSMKLELKKQIADLQHQLKVSKMTTKLACDELRDLNYRTFDNVNISFEQQFKEQAEKEMEGE